MKTEKSCQKNQNQNNEGRTVEVLYQKLGESWFAFSLIEDEVFFSPVSESEIQATRGTQPIFIKAGNS